MVPNNHDVRLIVFAGLASLTRCFESATTFFLLVKSMTVLPLITFLAKSLDFFSQNDNNYILKIMALMENPNEENL